MALIPVFEKCSRDYLIDDWEMEFPPAEHVESIIEGESYESNRFDVRYYDFIFKRTISVYMYFDESCEELYAIDEVVSNVDSEDNYYVQETPFWDMLGTIKEYTNNKS